MNAVTVFTRSVYRGMGAFSQSEIVMCFLRYDLAGTSCSYAASSNYSVYGFQLPSFASLRTMPALAGAAL